MRICFWSTTFQSDNHVLADFLVRAGHDVTVVMENPEGFLRSPIAQVRPFGGRILPRSAVTPQTAGRGEFDVLVADNHLPSFPLAPRIFVLWHGFGWRVDDLTKMRNELKRLVGDVTRENPRFRWQAVGDWDREYRIRHSELDDDNVVALGSPFSDWLRPDAPLRAQLDRDALQASYSVDLHKPLVLLAPTWHHAGTLGHWGDEEQLLLRLVQHVGARGASVLLRMHDRHRYQAEYVRLVERVAERAGSMLALKWKNGAPDATLDLLLADVCISNYSSILNGYYHTGRPSIHIDPHDASASEQVTCRMFCGVPVPCTVTSPDQIWKLPPEEHGGLRARSFDELLAQVDRALAEPDCCRSQAAAFIARYVTRADGHSAARTAHFLERWLKGEEEAA